MTVLQMMDLLRPKGPSLGGGWVLAVALLLMSVSVAQSQDMESVFSNFGTATAEDQIEDEAAQVAQAAETGTVVGQVFNGETGEPIRGVTVILIWPPPEGGGQSSQKIEMTNSEGAYAFSTVPPGLYSLSFIKSGYRTAAMKDFEVRVRQENRADFPLPPKQISESGQVMNLDAFVVEASTVNEMMASLELRMEADSHLNIMSAEDFSKFAAGDVAEALKRVAGVNVVEGQFAIIRGLEDRYSSTLFNSAVVPSPDPDKQSVQLDLFPSSVVSNLMIAKTFTPELPSNSSGGSIDIQTEGYPEEFTFTLGLGAGFNENAIDGFMDLRELSFTGPDGQEIEHLSPMGVEIEGTDTIDSDISGSLGGRTKLLGRELRFKAAAKWETDYDTALGYKQTLMPRLGGGGLVLPPLFNIPDSYSGGLAYGRLELNSGRFDLMQSERLEQKTGYGGFGFDLDEEGRHKVDLSIFYTQIDQSIVELNENGYIPGFDYTKYYNVWPLTGQEQIPQTSAPDRPPVLQTLCDLSGRGCATPTSWIGNGNQFTDAGVLRADFRDSPSNGPAWYAAFSQSSAYDTERDLLLSQLNGNHEPAGALDGLKVKWAGNYARSTQQEVAAGSNYFFEPEQRFPVPPNPPQSGQPPSPEFTAYVNQWYPKVFPSTPAQFEAMGLPGGYFTNRRVFYATNNIVEEQGFGRLDLEYTFDLSRKIETRLSMGGFFEHAERNVDATYLESPTAVVGGKPSSQFALPTQTNPDENIREGAPTPFALGALIFGPDGLTRDYTEGGKLQGLRETTNEALREVAAWYGEAKFTFWDDLDVLGGLRIESLKLTSDNNAFTNELNPLTGEYAVTVDGTRPIYPSKYLFFDRLDNPYPEDPLKEELTVAQLNQQTNQTAFNDQLIGFPVRPDFSTSALNPDGLTNCTPRPRDGSFIGNRGCVDLNTTAKIESALNQEIDRIFYLPSVALAFRPTPDMVLRAAYSQTVARPSFREMGYYVTVDPSTNDVVVGNPSLGLSEVESYDARFEYTFGDYGDLFAFSGFYKSIDDPIEALLVRDPLNAESGVSSALYRTYFNNPNTADLWGIEMEARKTLNFLGSDFLENLSIGGNFTYIDAQVDRTEVEIERAQRFFSTGTLDTEPPLFSSLSRSRRLFGQPEWIANGDISFDHPDWGTQMTVAVFAISDVLDAAGTAQVGRNGTTLNATLDRYFSSFYQVDVIFNQTWEPSFLKGTVAFKISLKNVTDSVRKLIYDPGQTNREYVNREFRIGRDYSFSLSYTF
jgi:TonB-dependent receptor